MVADFVRPMRVCVFLSQSGTNPYRSTGGKTDGTQDSPSDPHAVHGRRTLPRLKESGESPAGSWRQRGSTCQAFKSRSSAPHARAVSDTAGRFTINDVPVGQQVVRAARLGYTPATQTVTVRIRPDG